jgi:hypothetical protein
VTFISQYQTDEISPSGPASPGADGASSQFPHDLWFPITQKQWEPASEGEFERRVPGHYDFWFENRNSIPVELGVKSKSCKCAELAFCILTPAESKLYQRWVNFAAADKTVAGCRGLLGSLCQIAMHEEKIPQMMGVELKWLEKPPDTEKGVYVARDGSPPMLVAPGGAGILRLNWGGPKALSTAERLTVRIWTQSPEDKKQQRSETTVELPLSFVPSVRAFPTEHKLDEFRRGDIKTLAFFCWSSIDGWFPLQVRESSGDPCITCAWERLPYQECLRLAATVPEGRVRALCAYMVTVTVHERLSETVQMPIGPFIRRLIVSGHAGSEETPVLVSGTVQGEVIVGAEDDQGRINLGSYAARTGSRKIVHLTTLGSASDLTFDRVEPPTLDYLKVKYFKKTGGASAGQTRWELCVEVPPGSPPGALPHQCAIYLKTPGKSSRDICIPVSGVAYQ